MRDKLVADLDIQRSTLIFTNTRYQAEKWYQEILGERPEWAGLIALHHGSLAAEQRRKVDACRQRGTTLLMASHSQEVMGRADRLVRLERGRIVPG